MSLDIKFNRLDKTYQPGEKVSGVVIIEQDAQTKHNGLTLNVLGRVNLQLSARSMGIFEAFSNSLKPQPLIQYEIPVAPAGKFSAGRTELPFEFILKPLSGSQLHDTYHGVYVNIKYTVSVEMAKGMFGGNPIKVNREFFVELKRDAEIESMIAQSKPLPFKLVPSSLQNVRETARKKIPDFRFEGQINSTLCPIDQAFTGSITVHKCAVPIKSIEIQLARVESCVYPDGVAREATEIQNIQVADGDPLRELEIPLYMVFPRLFTCSTTISKTFRIEFQVNLIVLFEDNHMITENFPIILIR